VGNTTEERNLLNLSELVALGKGTLVVSLEFLTGGVGWHRLNCLMSVEWW